MATLETSKSILLRGMVPWLTVSLWKQLKEYSATFFTEFLVMASQILIYKLAAHYLGKTGFSEYSLSRRTVSLLQPLVMLGMGVGLPRYIALVQGRAEKDRGQRYFGAALRFVGLATLSIVAALLLAKGTFAYLLFGNSAYSYLMPPLAMMLVGLSIHSIVYSYFRGQLFLRRANALNLANLGVAPILVFFWFGTRTSTLLWGLGGAWTTIALLSLVWTPLQAVMNSPGTEDRELFRYGLQRVPGDFILLALLALPAIFIAHKSGIEKAGYVAFGMSITNMIASLFAPIGVILLPKASRGAGSGLLHELRKEIWLLGMVAVAVPVAIVIVVEIFAPTFVRLYLGNGFESAVGVVRLVIVAAVPLALYYVLRNVIDAFRERAINAINLCASLVLCLAVSASTLWRPGISQPILWGFVSGTTLLAILTCREVAAILHPGDRGSWRK
jgi:O-antigen/teichoic acid export membrane protein